MKTLVTILGANGDLGSALIEQATEKNTFLSLLGVDKHETSIHENIKYQQCDLGIRDEIFSVLQSIDFSLYNKHVIISTVGLFGQPSFEDGKFRDDDFRRSIEVNLIGVCSFISNAVSLSKNAGIEDIRVVIVGSTAGNVGSLDLGYGIAKAGLNGFVCSLSKSLAKDGVICIGVNPGIFESSMSRSVSIERQNKARDATHLKRIGTLKEICEFVSHIAFQAPDHLTGSVISINGGQYT